MSDAHFELYRDEAGEWRWRLVHRNGNILADSGEGYSRKADARTGLRSVKANAADARVEEVE
ncbi:HVO_2922 family protein [Halomarina litorea]|uniref:HVO_2922 family protein n=1 Tax=Halomarina litorea TaxID=2961595 RepID=UPI003F5DFE0D